MKLRNKKTGEVFDALIREKGGGGSYSLIVCDVKAYEHSKSTLDATHFVLDEYDSLAKLNEEWEDYEEPKEYWYVYETSVQRGMVGDLVEDGFKQIGNYFKTKEEAERVVEYLKALAVVRGDAKSKFTKGKNNWSVFYSTNANCLYSDLECYSIENGIFGLPYFATKEDAQRSIELHKKEWLTIFGVEEEE